MGFDPSHAVPDGGLRAWAVPDPSLPSTTLEAGLAVEVVERRGQWVQVKASNGWSGWVDGNRLVAMPAPPPAPAIPGAPPAPSAPTGRARRWGIGASLLLVFATVVDWDRPIDFDFGGQNFSGWDFPLVFLFDYELSSTKGVSIGLFLVIVAAVALAVAHSPQAVMIWRISGGVTLLVGVLHAVQAQRLMSDFGGGWALDYLGPGFFLAMAAGVGLVVAPARPPEPNDHRGHALDRAG